MQSAALTAPITGAFRKARQAMQGDPHAKLASARERIKALEKRLGEIEAEIETYHRRFSDKVEQARKQFEASKSFEDEFQYRLARIVEKDNRDGADPLLRAAVVYGAEFVGKTLRGQAFPKFVAENPDWREPFADAIEAKLAVAKRSYEETVASARAYLTKEFADDEAIGSDSHVKRAKNDLVCAESLESRFADAEGLKAWEIGISSLAQ
jgi:hypothetical protein